jgi:hypothetical protein
MLHGRCPWRKSYANKEGDRGNNVQYGKEEATIISRAMGSVLLYHFGLCIFSPTVVTPRPLFF